MRFFQSILEILEKLRNYKPSRQSKVTKKTVSFFMNLLLVILALAVVLLALVVVALCILALTLVIRVTLSLSSGNGMLEVFKYLF